MHFVKELVFMSFFYFNLNFCDYNIVVVGGRGEPYFLLTSFEI